MSEWQPIETAPRDGSPVLVGRIVGVRVTWWHEARPPEHGIMWGMKGGSCDPTHWFALPLTISRCAETRPANPAGRPGARASADHHGITVYCTECELPEQNCSCQKPTDKIGTAS